jgi:hypothetical protein
VYSALWSPRLRQGDVVGPVRLPTIGKNFQSIVTESSLTGTTPKQQPTQVIIEAGYHHVAIISHCCEFNEGKRNKFLVARLQTPQGNLSAEQYEALRLSNDIQARVEANLAVAGVDSFFLEPIPGHIDGNQVVVFTSITAVPLSMQDDFLTAKRAELDQEHRIQFRGKLAWFFGRAADDIPDDEKVDPR